MKNKIDRKADNCCRIKSVWRNAVTMLLVAGAVLLLVVGAKNGGMAEVIQKARFICLECIGIG